MAMDSKISRRTFIATVSTAGAALVLGFYIESKFGSGKTIQKDFRPNAWLKIGTDDLITVLVEKPELGQGSRTYTAMMIAEELEVEWSAIRVEQAPTIPSIYRGLRTGSSSGVSSTYSQMRRVGAQAREMMLATAAQRWHADIRDCRAENGAVVQLSTQRRARYGELVPGALQ